MPLGRNARQRQARPPKYKNNAYVPRVDVFGTLRLEHSDDVRGRLIEYAPRTFAFFTVSTIEDPFTFLIDGDLDIKGRVFRATIEGAEMRFQKAGCGCETPHELRLGRNRLLENVPVLQRTNEVSAIIETFPGVVSELTPDELTEQLQSLPGASIQ